MTKIIGLCGSPREGATEYFLKYALDYIKKIDYNIETDLILLRNKKIKYCSHCYRCGGDTENPIDYCIHDGNDDMDSLIDRFIDGHGYIIASPVCYANMSGKLKTFMDRTKTRCFGLNKGFKHKYRVGGSMAIGGVRHGGQESTLNSINNFFLTYGFMLTSGEACSMQATGNYLGASVWVQDLKPPFEDKIGIERVEMLARRIAEASKMISTFSE
ncbi:MAG: flavodoxin family protein [bacterium]|nr:flavodoxin family protein [bacterium]